MSELDAPTVLAVSSVLIVVAASLYVLEVWRHGRAELVDRCWSLTFLAAIVTTFAYLGSATSPALWWAVGLGNGAFVLALGTMWSGARARAGHRPLIGAVIATAVGAGVAALAFGPDGGPWAGALAYLLGVAGWAVLAGVELLRGPLRHEREGLALATVCVVASVFYALRAVVYAAGSGPGTPLFDRWFDTATTTMVNLVLIVVGSFSMIALRARETTAVRALRYDPVLGTRTPELLRAGVARGPRRVVVLALEVVDLPALRDAFGPAGPERAWAAAADAAGTLAPAEGLVGTLDGGPGELVVVLAGGRADGEAWLRELRRALLDDPVDVDGDVLGVDVASGVAAGYHDELDVLVARARAERDRRVVADDDRDVTDDRDDRATAPGTGV